jgi:hypothetical protein
MDTKEKKMTPNDILHKQYQLTTAEYEQCNKFAVDVAPTIGYLKNRNQYDEEKIKHDNVRGKIAEIVVYKTLPLITTPPDFTIYPKTKKNWRSDLFSINAVKLQVKSCEYNQQDDETSWLFQDHNKDGKKGRDLEFFAKVIDTNLYAVFVLADIHYGYGEIVTIVRATDLKKHELYGQCRKKEFHNIKYAVYLRDLRAVNLDDSIPVELMDLWRSI